jgi:aminoglycoside phosphotransferase (APT) family kinase protein
MDHMTEAALAAWFTAADPTVTPPLTLDLLSGGHSNLTYRVTDATGRRFVLRRPPAGAAGIHDVVREHRIAGALAGSGVPVAPLVGIGTDDAVLGVPFGVSGWVDGHVVETPADAEAVLTGACPHHRRRAAGRRAGRTARGRRGGSRAR